MRAAVVPALSMLSAVACSPVTASHGQPDATDGQGSTPAVRGLAFAQSHCAGCHAVTSGVSPNSAAPSFEDVVNTPGLDAGTLRPWLLDSHNFPQLMNFSIAPEQVDDLAAYMLTLKDPDYRPPVQ